MGDCKYYKYQKYVSYDNGQSWNPLNEYQKGGLYEICSEDCGYVPSYRWISNGYECDENFPDLYQILKKQYSFDGNSWYDVNPLETKKVIYEMDSIACGFEKQDMYGLKYFVKETKNNNTNIYSGNCCFDEGCVCDTLIGEEIGYDANYYNSGRHTIIIGDCVSYLKDFIVGAHFNNNIILPNSLLGIGASCFGERYNSSGITDVLSKIDKINMVDNIQYIGASAFTMADLTNVRDFNIPCNLRVIGEYALAHKKRILNKPYINFPNIRFIYDGAFFNCIPDGYTIDTIDFGKYLIYIGGDAFAWNGFDEKDKPTINNLVFRNILYPNYERNFTSTTFSRSIEPIFDASDSCPFNRGSIPLSSGVANHKFGYNAKINKIYVPKHSKNKFISHFMGYVINGYTENDYIGRISPVLHGEMPEVVELDEEPYLPNINQIGMIYSQYDEWYPVYGGYVNDLSFEFFKPYGIPYAKKYVIYEGVTEILFPKGYYGHNSLEEVVIPSTVSIIRWGAFNRCINLTKMTIYATKPPEGRGMNYAPILPYNKITTIYVPAESVEAYKADRDWNNYAKEILPIPNS